MSKTKYIVGVDEAGRGPLAGPLAVGAVCVPSNFDWELLPGVNDSKKLSAKSREAIFRLAKDLKKEGKLNYAVAMTSASQIDRLGLSKCLDRSLDRSLKKVAPKPESVSIKLDGSLKAPDQYIHQETIIKGDQKEKVIGLASILAKVTRDKLMERISKQEEFTRYEFAIHKGYGTRKHRLLIKKHGLSTLHRQSFCKNV